MKNTQIYGKRERKIKIKRKYFREKDKKNVFKKKRKENDSNFRRRAKISWEKNTFCGKKVFSHFSAIKLKGIF